MSDKPTAGAMRAAELIWQECHTISQPHIANIIDRETGLPELLAALNDLREWVRRPGEDDSPANEAVIDRAEAAIAKATRGLDTPA